MKRRFSKILGVGLTLALLTSLVLTAAPVSADVSEVSVVLSDYEISATANYTITFKVNVDLPAAATTDTITVVFPEGTDASGLTADGDVKVRNTVGIWGGTANSLTDIPAADVTVDTDNRTVTIIIDNLTSSPIWAGASVEIIFANTKVKNPDAAATNLFVTVATSTETTAVESPVYAITVPDVGVLAGIVQQFNAVGILMAQATGDQAIDDMVDAAGDNYTIVVGPGEYDLLTGTIINITKDGVTLKSSAGAADTTIDATGATGYAVTVSGDDVVVEGFTVTSDDVGALKVTGADAIVKDNIMTAAAGYPEGINIGAAGATVSGNVLDIYNTMMVIGASDATLSDNTFGAGINVQGSTGITITGNAIVGSELTGIVFESSVSSDILIEDNTISATTLGDATGIYFRPSIGTYDKIRIVGNDITDNEGDGIGITTGNTLTNSVIKFNTITGNDTSTGDYGIQNDSATAVDATFNWWGTTVAADIAAMVSGTSAVTTDPFLAGTAEAVLSASDVATSATALDAKITVGVRVEGVATATTISAAKYIANPQAAKAGAIAYFDVYVAGGAADDAVTIKFYAGDANTEVYIWSAGTDLWAPVDAEFSVYGGYVYVTVFADLLGGTPFALVAGAGEALTAPRIISPDVGEKDVDLRPTFAWTAIAGVLGYEFELADNPNFVAPLMKLSGELGRLIVPYYQYMPQLDYSKAYYWRVRSVDATAESGWVGGVFITVAEVIPEPEEPEWMCSEGLTFASREALEAHLATAEAHKPVEPPEIIVEPDVEVIVPLPAETQITPAWIYVIIGVGAVLVIALIVLIVRTRRVA